MTIHAFTSFSYSYLNRARILASSLRAQHPDWVIWAVLTDKEPEGFTFDLDHEDFDRVLTAEEMYGDETEQWLFGHDIVEACTAVKGRASVQILNEPDCEKLFYFDPDIGLFNPMTPVVDLLDDFSIVLTPHQVDPEPQSDKMAIQDNEIASLDYGIFNLGFVAMANDTEFGLACYYYTKDLGRTWRMSEALEYGIVGINTGIISTEVAPFGGMKESGFGREGSKYGIDDYLEVKYLLMAGVDK